VRIAFDEAKRLQNIAKHGLDFAVLDMEFFATSTIVPAKAGRFMAIGMFEDRAIISVIFAPLGTEAISIISMRKASRKERSIL
jgi:uncharacterized DUF497 family protein